MSSPLRVQVVIPHFFREGSSEGRGGYGSGRDGNRLPRSLALARCLSGVLALNRAPQDWILNIAERQVERTPPSSLPGLSGIEIDLHLFVCGEHWLQEVVELYASRLMIHQLELDDPRQLPLLAVRHLLDMEDTAHISMYLEDDLVIHDPLYIDKLAWFYEKTEHKFVLMPHRSEPTVANAPVRLYVDGPIKITPSIQSVWSGDEAVAATGRFLNGQDISFAIASNPHSGSFCLTAQQIERVRNSSWPPSTFVGPLETAATGTILPHFPILKPCWNCRSFLALEHGNPSFLSLLNELPFRK